RDLSTEVSTPERFSWKDKEAELNLVPGEEVDIKYRVAVVDCGVKYNQLRIMARMGCDVEVFPNSSSAGDILDTRPDGIFVSNGPGDPAGVPQVSEMVRTLAESGTPTFGICFGHQMLARAMGGQTYKLKFGHRGANQPVQDLSTGKVEITSQNHGFCVDIDSLPDDIETSHINLNDRTSEGLQHKKLPMFSVQYHPEAAPGPRDAEYLFRRFIGLMDQQKT
ncbi:MAG: carbamoyl phosphate synthase small subunit, partial [Verrucomicrobiota bacterium]